MSTPGGSRSSTPSAYGDESSQNSPTATHPGVPGSAGRSRLERLQLRFGTPSANFTCWRSLLPLPTDKLGFILDNEVFTDITFAAGENAEKISGHKLLLATSSPVFEAMLLGPLAAPQGDVIHIPDVQPIAFRLLLKFIYTGKFTATIQNAVDLMYASKKYDIIQLTLKCSELLRSDLTEKNAVTVLQAAQLLDDTELERKAEIFLTRNFGKVIEDEDFLNFSNANLCRFLEKDEIDVSEMDLFDAVLKWGEAETSRRDFEDGPGPGGLTGDKHRVVLHDVIKLLRFPLISPEDFALNVIPKHILSTEVALQVLQFLCVPMDKRSQLESLDFCTRSRNTNSVYTAHFAIRFTDMVFPYVSHISYFDSFEVDQYISITGVGFPAPDIDDAAYDVAVQIQVQGSNMLTAQTNQSLICKRRSVMRVNFETPVRIEPNVLYKVVYKLKLTGHDVMDRKLNIPMRCGWHSIRECLSRTRGWRGEAQIGYGDWVL